MIIIKTNEKTLIDTLLYKGDIYERNHYGSWWLLVGGAVKNNWMFIGNNKTLLESEYKKAKPIREVKLNRILNEGR